MAKLTAIVYDPPATGFPFLAVMFDHNGEVLVARAVPSQEAGEQLLANVASDIAAQRGKEK
jgi:hypothetical protein